MMMMMMTLLLLLLLLKTHLQQQQGAVDGAVSPFPFPFYPCQKHRHRALSRPLLHEASWALWAQRGSQCLL